MAPDDPIARLSVEILREVLEGAPADRTLKRVFRREHLLRDPERKEIAHWVYRVSLHRARLAHGLTGGWDRNPTERAQLLLAKCWAVDDNADILAALSRAGLPADAPGANALRSAIEQPPPLPASPIERLAIERSLPLFVAQALAASLGVEETDRLMAHLNEPGPITLRAHGQPPDRDSLIALLHADGIETRATVHSPWGLHVVPPAVGKANLWGSGAFRAGKFEVQDEGSQLIALACAAQPEEVVVDYCAGRGGKTLALAAQMAGRGRLIATDVDAAALKDLHTRLHRARETWVECRHLAPAPNCALEPPAALLDLVQRADLVLVDGPCSAVGSWRRGPHRRWELSSEQLQSWPHTQKAILARARQLVRPGGRLLYATCTMLPAENQEVSASFLAEHPDFAPHPLPLKLAGGASELSLYPHRHGCDGFYLSLFRRIDP